MPPTPLHRLLYVSRACIDPCGDEPRRILEVATHRNASLDVTGLLCFSGDHFAQILEGQAAAIESLMTSIRVDPRHRMLREWPARAVADGVRLFPRWVMGYCHDEQLDRAMVQLTVEPHDIPMDTLACVLFAGLELYRARPAA